MPLKKVISAHPGKGSVATEVKKGTPRRQAVAIAYTKAGVSKGVHKQARKKAV